MSEMISLAEAAAAGITRVRDPKWATPTDHVKLDIIDGKPGPWVHLFSTQNAAFNGRDPVDMLAVKPQIDVDERSVVPYAGPVSTDPEYVAAAEAFSAHFARSGGT